MGNDFDKKRVGTGTAEWAEVNENICRGCANNCLYCYAASNANRFGQRKREDWAREELTKRADIKHYPARDGVIMFPSSHDITPFNVDAYIRVANLILESGNKLLIVSKPRLECVEKMIDAFMGRQSQILFRFTMGTTDPSISLFWEPGATEPNERHTCLVSAFLGGYHTSVSIEPMLQGFEGTVKLVELIRKFVTDTIWIGKMNKARLRVPGKYRKEVEWLEELQNDGQIMALYERYNDDPIIRWKDSINAVVEKHRGRNGQN